MKISALGVQRYLSDRWIFSQNIRAKSNLFKFRWNQLDVSIVFLSIIGIALEEVQGQVFPINPTIIRVMRVLRIARVLKLLKMAKGIRALLDTVMQALPQVKTNKKDFYKSKWCRLETLDFCFSCSSSYLLLLVLSFLGDLVSHYMAINLIKRRHLLQECGHTDNFHRYFRKGFL